MQSGVGCELTAGRLTSCPSPLISSPRFSASWRVGLLVLVTTLVWAAHYGRWTPADWAVPTDYAGDAHEVLARIKAAGEGETWPLRSQEIERLGAPFGADWNAYPTPDKPLMLALGALGRGIGLFAAANLGLLLAQVSAALAFYLVARRLAVRWEWAWAGALLFAYSYHTFHRGLAHFSFVFTWTVPVGLLAVWLVAQSRRLRWRSGGAAVCGLAALGLGWGNPYLLLFWGQLLVWALVFQWCGPRRRENLTIGLAAGGLAVAVFLAANLEFWVHAQEPEGLPLLTRNYGGTERYALKPVEMFIPPEYHRWAPLAALGQRYQRWSEWHGEPFLPYLGVCGIAGFLVLAAVALRQLLRRRPLPGAALAGSWLLAYASVGGVTNVLAFFAGFQLFRATNRAAVFLSALVLFFLVVRLSRWTAGWTPAARVATALVLAAAGLLDQLPRRPDPARQEAIAAAVRSDARLMAELESALPAGAPVFQLPVLGFPEVVPPHRLTDYEHFRPYLLSTHLRFSYGAAKHRARGRWQRDLEGRPTEELVRRLEAAGFAALHVNRKGFEDRGERLLRELEQLGYPPRLQSALGNQVVVLLRPSPQPQPPLARALTFGQGWHLRPDAGVRWAGGRAVLSYYNPHPVPVEVDVRLDLVAPRARRVRLEHAGRVRAEVAVEAEGATLRVRGLSLPPGISTLTLTSPDPVRREGAGPNQLRAFGLREQAVRVRGGEQFAD